MKDILVIGGSNIDYAAISENALIPNDSNIGKLKTSYGGVGRNTVENLALLKDRVSFITAIGDDAFGQKLKTDLRKLDVKLYTPTYHGPSSSYLAIYDNRHDMYVAVCDTEILDKMKYSDILPFRKVIEKHHNIVLEANINQEVIDHLFQDYFSHRFYVEAVSANKVVRFKKHLKKIYLYKSNVLEARYLLEMDEGPTKLAEELMKRGVSNVIITDGSGPITIGSNHTVEVIPVSKAENVVSSNGAGDALFAGVLHGLYNSMSLKDSVEFGKKMSLLTLQSPKAVNPEVSNLVTQEE